MYVIMVDNFASANPFVLAVVSSPAMARLVVSAHAGDSLIYTDIGDTFAYVPGAQSYRAVMVANAEDAIMQLVQAKVRTR